MEEPIATSQEDHIRSGASRFPALNQVSLVFLENMKIRFGEQSYEAAKIHDILGQFASGEISKRHTISTILNIISGHDNLRHDLFAILNHDDARWTPRDFDLSPKSVPQFLQLTHEPQMCLPSISVPWESNRPSRSSFRSLTSAVYNAYANPDEAEVGQGTTDTQSEHDHQQPTPQITLPWPGQAAYANSSILGHVASPDDGSLHDDPWHPNTHYDPMLNQPNTESFSVWEPERSRYLQSWREVEYGNPGAENRHLMVPQRGDMPLDDGSPPSTAVLECHFSNGSHENHSRRTTLSPFVHQEQALTRTLQPLKHEPELREGYEPAMSLEMLPPAMNYEQREASPCSNTVATQRFSSQLGGLEDVQSEVSATDTRPFKRLKATTTAARSRAEGSGEFIHGLCGKRFKSRSKVKKHHWGNKKDDLDTTTGCWAKHKKPNIRWDDHPSCREAPKVGAARRTSDVRTSKHTESRLSSAEHKALTVPAMIPSRERLHSHRILHDEVPRELPKRTADSPHTSLQYPGSTLSQYHSHHLPGRRSFESLLSAVNMVSEMEAPVPQGRNDSLVAQLDAQAAAVDYESHYRPGWTFESIVPCNERVYDPPKPDSGPAYTSREHMLLPAPYMSEGNFHPGQINRYG
ncbi:hypothetical protein EK21DRAFT_117400 [Setomelanomma holmii]|uniref:Uncharacterized protein n=1 Tax=Setomelanomma holmii TaxID=210430 RepID=A0A9P4LH36_9PLEO|nr:hypothetical protein EK21DRAFT_117400 [Setomelanomma holmii]